MTEAPSAPGALTDLMWADALPIYEAILAHPFLTGLTSGELPEDRFAHYVRQDAHYLSGYARALAALAARAPDPTTAALLASHASNAVAVEQELHGGLLAELGRADVAPGPGPGPGPSAGARPGLSAGPAPTTVSYTSYLLAAAHGGSFAEGLAAVLPCYWIYWEVGKALAATGSPHPLYARWIQTYGGEGFADLVRPVLALTDAIGAAASAQTCLLMRDRYLTAARFEWMFWDAAYRLEGWPV